MDWIHAKVLPRREVSGPLSELPFELAYPGDATWDETSPMDALISLRLWAPQQKIMPAELWEKVKERIKLPTDKEFVESLVSYTEVANGRSWSKDSALFGHVGECSYDTDWYNGLTLSGLYRACICDDEEISVPAGKLAAAIKQQRAEMLAYFEIYSDYSLQSSWSDPRGCGWDPDCSHNGMEGILAEAHLREMEGDTAGSNFALYLAGKMAVSFIATLELGKHCVRLGLTATHGAKRPESPDEVYGVRSFRETRGSACVTPAMRNPCIATPDFPQYCALLKRYAPREHFEKLTAAYQKNHPGRYEDWLKFYVGDIADEIRSGKDKVGENQDQKQERRIEAAVFYHVAQDVAIRLWILDEDADAIEKRFAHPLPLSAQLWCRADARLSL